MVSYTDGNGASTQFEYDSTGHLISRTWSNNTKVIYSYYPTGEIKTKEENNRKTQYFYDSRNRLNKTQISSPTTTYTRTIQYVNPFSYLPKNIKDNNSEIHYKYDTFGRPLTEITHRHTRIYILTKRTTKNKNCII